MSLGPYTVWAPDAQRVDLVIDGEGGPTGEPMTRVTDARPGHAGWWRSETPRFAGTRYGFALDGGEPLPDPRSLSQPDGPFGLSEVVDTADLAWSDDGWAGVPLRGAVIYELHVGTFTEEGTFDAAVARLDHLVDLGVTLVEVMPVATYPGERGWGYDGVLPYAPDAGPAWDSRWWRSA